MKIRPDQIEGVSPEQTQRKNKAQQSGQAFGEFLSQEVAKGDAPAATQAMAPPLIVNPLIAAEAMSSVQSVDSGAASVAGQVESILDKWDDYAANLSGSGSGLKSAYGTLDEIANDVATLKSEQPDLASQPGLKSIVDDLEAMAVTERFKFNRGDYV